MTRPAARSTFCAEHGISRKSFYELRRRAKTDGPAAVLELRTRRPKTSPSKLTEEVKQQAITVRAALEASGLNHGGRKCVIFQLIDDHSSYAVASHVA